MEHLVSELKNEILDSYNQIFSFSTLSEEIKKAFLDIDRHSFVDYYFLENDLTNKVSIENTLTEKQLRRIYKDTYLPILVADDNEEILSSLSQPSLVLYMLNIANINSGDNVLEIGTASGWNGALLSNLVGKNGTVDTVEIVNDLADRAKKRYKDQGISNINVHVSDDLGANLNKQFDAIIFTVGTYDIPKRYFDLIKEDGRLIIVLKNDGGGDSLYSLKKNGHKLVADDGIPCGFVQIKGKYRYKELEPKNLSKKKDIKSLLLDDKLSYKKYWFGGNKVGSFEHRTSSFKSYLSISDPYFVAVKIDNLLFGNTTKEKIGFGIYNKDEYSLALLYNEKLIWSGSLWAKERLMNCLKRWVLEGMPVISSMSLEIRPNNFKRQASNDEVLVARDECYFYFKNII